MPVAQERIFWLESSLRHENVLFVLCTGLFRVFLGHLLDDGLKRGTPKALKGQPLSLLFCLSVCLSVNTLQVTVFDPAT